MTMGCVYVRMPRKTMRRDVPAVGICFGEYAISKHRPIQHDTLPGLVDVL